MVNFRMPVNQDVKQYLFKQVCGWNK